MNINWLLSNEKCSYAWCALTQTEKGSGGGKPPPPTHTSPTLAHTHTNHYFWCYYRTEVECYDFTQQSNLSQSKYYILMSVDLISCFLRSKDDMSVLTLCDHSQTSEQCEEGLLEGEEN